MYQISYKNVSGCFMKLIGYCMFKLLFLLLFLKNNRVKIDLLFYINAELWDLDDTIVQV
jgi:hypothetical protein